MCVFGGGGGRGGGVAEGVLGAYIRAVKGWIKLCRAQQKCIFKHAQNAQSDLFNACACIQADYADAQADLGVRFRNTPEDLFSHDTAQTELDIFCMLTEYNISV